MPLPLKKHPLTTSTRGVYDPIILEFTADLRRRGKIAEGRFRHYMARARHFLIWLAHRGLALEAVDGTVIDRFLHHDCDCREAGPAAAGLRPWRTRRTSPHLMHFIHFLERTGRIATPGDLDEKYRLLNRFFVGKTRIDYDPIILEFTADLRRRGETTEGRIYHYKARARHFLIWVAHRGLSLEAVDGTVIDRFLRHDCDCREAGPAAARLRPSRKRRTSPELMRFIRFLERTGRIATPGDLDENFRLLEAFLDRLRADGYAQQSIRSHRSGCAALIVWLHLARVRLCDLTPDVYARFRRRGLTCSIPGVFGGRRTHSRGGVYRLELRKFLGYLGALGRIAPVEPIPEETGLSEPLEAFSVWLERCRGITPATVRRYIHLIAPVLPALGEDPRAYTAALIRDVLFQCLERRTRAYAKEMANAMRMYLRCLVWEGCIDAALVEAVPTIPRWRLSALPRHIAPEDVERAIATCGDDPLGVRDRAILLLLARLALRAGDIVALRLDDIDWDRAEIRVAGKSALHTALPLPQDAGDALLAYIETVRPAVDEHSVFLCALAPYRPLGSGSTVSTVAKRALNRADVTGIATRGAHVFRHSQATALLRSGATFDTVQSLLRHQSRETTLIYAKTDAVMLQEVAQPWIGGTEE